MYVTMLPDIPTIVGTIGMLLFVTAGAHDDVDRKGMQYAIGGLLLSAYGL